MLAARALLDRECLRLVPNCPVGEAFRGYTLMEASSNLMLQADTARRAVGLMGTESISAGAEALMSKLLEAARTELVHRQKALESAMRKVLGEAENAIVHPQAFEPTWRVGAASWIIPEIDRRWRRVQEIIEHAEKVPAWALEDRAQYARLKRVLPTDVQYERRLRREIAAQRAWGAKDPVFLPFVPFEPQGLPGQGMGM
jgi:hypothetical protein